MSHEASGPGWKSTVAVGGASLSFTLPPMNSIRSVCPCWRSPLCWRFFKQNTWPPSSETLDALGVCRPLIGLENFRLIFQPPSTFWGTLNSSKSLNPFGQSSSKVKGICCGFTSAAVESSKIAVGKRRFIADEKNLERLQSGRKYIQCNLLNLSTQLLLTGDH